VKDKGLILESTFTWLHEKWVDENKKPDGSDGIDLQRRVKNLHQLSIPECNFVMQKKFRPYANQIFRKSFIQSKMNKKKKKKKKNPL
jgi:hypothetical protein